MPWLHPKRRNLPWSNPKPRKISDEDDKKWIKEEDSRNFLQKTFNNNKTRNFNQRREKRKQQHYTLKKYVKEEGSYKNRKFCQEPRLAHERQVVHNMLNVPMNEQCLVWFIK